MAAHSWWRVRYATNDLHSHHSAVAVEMRAVRGGPNVASGGTASASSLYDGASGAANAFDGNASTFWSSNGEANPTGMYGRAWLAYHFAAPVDIVEVAWTARSNFYTQCPRRAFVESSDDGVLWTVEWHIQETSVWTASATRVWSKPLSQPDPGGTFQHWRLRFWGADNAATTVAFRDLELHATVGGADICTGGTESAEINNATLVLDSDATESFWYCTTQSAWWRYSFASPVHVTEVKIRARTGANMAQAPRIFDLEYSPDGSTWYVGASFDSYAASALWTDAQSRTFVGVPASAVVTSITPSTGSPLGGTAVTISGSGFTGATGATVGGVALTSFAVVNDGTITGVTGAHAAGAVDVVVGGVTLAGAFTYVWTLTVTPDHGPAAGGTSVLVVRS